MDARRASARKALLEEQGPSAIGFYTTGQLFLEEYYTLASSPTAAIGTNHVDGNTRLCTATAAGRSRSPSAATANPAPTPTSTTPTSSRSSATTSPKPRPCCGCGCWTGSPAPTRPRSSASTRAGRRCRAGRRAPGAAAGHQRRADERRCCTRSSPTDWVDHDYIEAHTVGFDELAKRCRRVHARAGRARSARARGRHPARRRAPRDDADRLLSDRAAGLLPVPPGDRRGRPGQQPAPPARHARQARLRHPADERSTHRGEHPRMRRRRRPGRVSQLEQRRHVEELARSGTSTRRRSRTTRRRPTRCR